MYLFKTTRNIFQSKLKVVVKPVQISSFLKRLVSPKRSCFVVLTLLLYLLGEGIMPVINQREEWPQRRPGCTRLHFISCMEDPPPQTITPPPLYSSLHFYLPVAGIGGVIPGVEVPGAIPGMT